MMIATDLVRATLHVLLAILILTGGVTLLALVVIEACYGAAEAFFRPAYSGLVPQTVPEEMILDARALTEWMANLAQLIGPALATLLVLGVGAGEAFLFDAATFVFSALMLARVHPRRGACRPVRRHCSPSCVPAGARCARARGCGSRSPSTRWRS